MEFKYKRNATNTDWEWNILVAPYWNLNVRRIEDGFNNYKILVAPYWNLNTIQEIEISFKCYILVAPYWNLNFCIPFDLFHAIDNISSSILEFKSN